MKIGIFYPGQMPHSLQIYTDNVVRELKDLGTEFVAFSERGRVPEKVDLLWDPRGGRGAPPFCPKNIKKPFVATFHGAAHLALPLSECFGYGIRAMLGGYRSRRWTLKGWHALRECLTGVIAVSEYAKSEFVKQMGFPEDKVFAVHHGVDHRMFYPGDGSPEDDRFILHVSSYQPKKNVDRIIAAYSALRMESKPRLLLVAPGYPNNKFGAGITLMRYPMTHDELRTMYQKAFFFLFPSLHETFGMPILEAMACGCPVITSNTTSCPEVAGDAALQVDPRSVRDISKAMKTMIADKVLRDNLRNKGMERVGVFTWKKSAKKHMEIFERMQSCS